MRIADRYVVREILAPFLLGVGGFVVLLAGDVMYALAEYVATRRLTAGTLLRLLAYKLPAIMVITFPVSTLFGTLLGLARLARDRELQALRLGGMSLARIFTPVLLFGALTAGAAFLTNEFVAPWANREANTLIRRAAFGDALPPVRQQIFFRGPGNRFFYIEEADRQQLLHNVMIYELADPRNSAARNSAARNSEALPRLITARRARWEGGVLRLADGVIREFDAQGFTRYEARFAGLDIEVSADSQTVLDSPRTPDEMTAGELRRYLAIFGGDRTAPRFVLELHRKFAVPLAAVIFALLAAPLGAQAAQGGRFLGVGISVLVLFLYYAVMSVGRALGATGGLPPAVAAWLPDLLFGVGGAWLWLRQDGWARVIRVDPVS